MAVKNGANFGTAKLAEVPHSRKGKHNGIVTELMSDLKTLETGFAMKVPLKSLGDTKEKVRSALNRASRKAGIPVATSSDEEFLYIWKEKQ